jgi:sialate O-acetylesterase
LELDDPIHVGTHGLKRLGRRMARVMAGEVYGVGDIEPGPRLERVEKVVRRGRPQIRVVFSGVNGALKPPRHIAGFTLRTRDNLKGPPFYEVRVAPDRPNTLLCMVHALPDTPLYLWYGYGANPYCNLVDEADMAVKAFGPVEIRAADAQEEPPAD